MFIQSKCRSRKDIEAACQDLFGLLGHQWRDGKQQGSESMLSLAVSVRPIHYEEVPQSPPYQILKKIDNMNSQ
jgi:hypothetical protein